MTELSEPQPRPNTAARWNKALLDNSARPSGALVYSAATHMTAEQFERLKGELEASFQGARNAGRPLLLEGGLDWRAMSLSPRDLDFMEAKHAAAREIALAIGVPPMLLGMLCRVCRLRDGATTPTPTTPRPTVRSGGRRCCRSCNASHAA